MRSVQVAGRYVDVVGQAECEIWQYCCAVLDGVVGVVADDKATIQVPDREIPWNLSILESRRLLRLDCAMSAYELHLMCPQRLGRLLESNVLKGRPI